MVVVVAKNAPVVLDESCHTETIQKSRLCALIRAKMGTPKPGIWGEITLSSGCEFLTNIFRLSQYCSKINLTDFGPEKVHQSTYYMFSLAVLFLYYRKSFEAIHSHKKGRWCLSGWTIRNNRSESH